MATRRLTIYLLREEVQEFDDALATDKPSDSFELDSSTAVDGRFHLLRARRRRPPWIAFVEPILARDIRDVWSSSTSGLLLLRAGGRIFAATFGFGRSLLDLSKIEPQFGLRVALNRIDPSQLRSLDTKTFEDMVVTTNRQTSRNAELPAFGIDVSTDILRAATGTPRDSNFAKRISGSDALVMNLETDATELPGLCERLLDAFGDEDYKADFGWIDKLSLIRDEMQIEALNGLLVDELASGAVAATHLASPEPVNWEDIDAFRIGGTRDYEYDDLDLEAYLNRLGRARRDITIERLKSRRVAVRFARADTFDHRWSLFQCLVSEQRTASGLCVLIEGRWFAVSESLVDEVDAFLGSLRSARVQLLASLPGEAEGAYNERVATSSPHSLLKLDAKIKRPGGAASGIELCDVLTVDGEFVHVKRKAVSATLSHLFAQGSVSARTFVEDGQFRDEIRALIEAEVVAEHRSAWLALVPRGSESVDRSRYSVTYAIVANTSRPGLDWLPFFSKLNLMQNGRQLFRLGFDVAVVRVPIEGGVRRREGNTTRTCTRCHLALSSVEEASGLSEHEDCR